MQITPISVKNPNFNGKIQPSKILSEIKSYANADSINRFDKLEKKLAESNNGIIYSFEKKNKYKMIGDNFEVNTNYTLHSNKEKEPLFTVISPRTAYSSPDSVKNNLSKILGIFVDFFEEKINTSETKEKSANKIKEILDNTI